jgi:hypothetical protein
MRPLILTVVLAGGIGCAPVDAPLPPDPNLELALPPPAPVPEPSDPPVSMEIPEETTTEDVCVQWFVEFPEDYEDQSLAGGREWEWRCVTVDALREQLFPESGP